MPGHKPRMPLEVPPHSSRARLDRNLRAHTPAFPPPTLSGPSPTPSGPPPLFPHPPPVFTGPPSSLHSRAAQTASRMAQIDRWPSHAATRAGLHRLACRAQAPCVRTSLGRGPRTSAGAPPTSAGTPRKTRGAPHFFACAPRPKPLRWALNLGTGAHPCHHPATTQRARSPGPQARPRHTR